MCLMIAGGACSPRPPVSVAVSFQSAWRIGTVSLSDSEVSAVRQAAIQTLKDAYGGFDVQFVEAAAGRRVIRIEDTPYGRPFFGAAGATFPASTSSSVRVDVLANALLAAAQCEDVVPCAKSRAELVAALGRAVGATAAHELGHQAGLGGFALDSRCDDCYDGRSTRFRHFFATKHWSADALAVMRRVLPHAR
jgi:hypothetical protein